MSVTPSLPLSLILPVSVVVSPTGAPGPQFNQALIVGSSTVIPTTGTGAGIRLRQYTSLAGMTADGFSTNAPEYVAATIYFGQPTPPFYLWVGRQNLTAMQGIIVGASGGTGYLVGDILTVVQGGATGGMVQVYTIGVGGAVTSVIFVPGAQGNGYSVAANLPTTGGSGAGCEISISSVGETPLEAVTACRNASPVWYACMFVGNGTGVLDSDNEAVAGFIQACTPPSVYFLNSSSATVLNNNTGNLFATLQSLAYSRTLMLYSTTQSGQFPNNIYAAAAPMGAAMGLNTGTAGSYFDLMFKALAGIGTEPLSPGQVNTIAGTANRSQLGLNGNVYLNWAANAYEFMINGTMANGSFFDQTLFLDMLASQIQYNGMNLLTSVPSVPLTAQGLQQMVNAITQACVASQVLGFIAPSGTWLGVTIGPISSGTPMPKGYFVYAPPISTLTQAQRAARQFPPINVLIIEAQAGQSLSVTIDVQQ